MKVTRKLMLGDCLERMKEIPDNSIDLIVTSPPYDNLRTYKNTLDWNFKVFKKIAKELKRVLKDGGVIVWVVGDATVKGSETGSSFKQALYFKKLGLNLADTMIYQKNEGYYPKYNHKKYPCAFEYMFVLSKGKIKTFNLLKDKPNKMYGKIATGSVRQKDGTIKPRHRKNQKIARYGARPNIWAYSVGYGKSSSDKIAFQHPAIFPEKLAYDHILSWSNKGDIVFDPFMGSGTVGKQAMILRRNFIGIEVVKQYFRISKKRIKNWKGEKKRN